MPDRSGIRSIVGVGLLGLSLGLVGTPRVSNATDARPVAAERTVLILPFDMVDTSLQGEINGGALQSDLQRLARTEQIVRRSVDHLPAFDALPMAAVDQQIAQAQQTYRYLYACNGCDVDIGRAAGADLVMTGWVQKVSNPILNINATLRRTDTGDEVGGASVDMRNDTDDSWRAAALYLVDHALWDNYRSRATDQPIDHEASQPAHVPVRRYPG